MRLFTVLDCEHFRACSPTEVGEAWVPRWTVDDLDAGLCTYRDLGKDKPAPVPAEQSLSLPEDVGPPTARQLRKDVLAAYTKLGGVAYLTALADESPPAFLKLLVNALHQTDPAAVADFSQLSKEDHRQLQIAEQNAIINAHRAASNAGDAKASEVIIKASDRLAKLLGTDQPRLVANFHSTGELNRLSDEELEHIARGGLTLIQGEDGTFAADE